MPIRVLIVDDEPLARKELRRLLAGNADVTIVGEASHVAEAEARIGELEPDLLLLDIQMPGGTGFDLLARLDNPPRVIFTTAYDEHALRAFEVNALDYLLKPVDPPRLAEAVARMTALISKPLAATEKLDRLFARDGNRCWFVTLSEVRLLESDGNYTLLHWNDQKPAILRSLVALEPRLDPNVFFRANRKQILALPYVEKVEIGEGGRLYASLRGGPDVEISRRQARAFREMWGA